MRQYLVKSLEVAGRCAAWLWETSQWLWSWMRSVEIDRQRGALLCVALQGVIVLGLLFLSPRASVPPQVILDTPEVAAE